MGSWGEGGKTWEGEGWGSSQDGQPAAANTPIISINQPGILQKLLMIDMLDQKSPWKSTVQTFFRKCAPMAPANKILRAWKPSLAPGQCVLRERVVALTQFQAITCRDVQGSLVLSPGFISIIVRRSFWNIYKEQSFCLWIIVVYIFSVLVVKVYARNLILHGRSGEGVSQSRVRVSQISR